MGFIKAIIGLPLLVIILIFAFVNNDLATFSLWPFSIEITVSLSVAVLFFIIFGFLLGSFFSWMSYAPVRKDLRKQRKKNKKLSKQQKILADTVSDLQGNLEQIRAEKEAQKPAKRKLFGWFGKKPEEEAEPVENKENGTN